MRIFSRHNLVSYLCVASVLFAGLFGAAHWHFEHDLSATKGPESSAEFAAVEGSENCFCSCSGHSHQHGSSDHESHDHQGEDHPSHHQGHGPHDHGEHDCAICEILGQQIATFALLGIEFQQQHFWHAFASLTQQSVWEFPASYDSRGPPSLLVCSF